MVRLKTKDDNIPYDIVCATCAKILTGKNWYKIANRKEFFCTLACLEKWEKKYGVKL